MMAGLLPLMAITGGGSPVVDAVSAAGVGFCKGGARRRRRRICKVPAGPGAWLSDGSGVCYWRLGMVGTLATWAAVSAGAEFSLMLRNDGTLWACGQNFNNYTPLGIN